MASLFRKALVTIMKPFTTICCKKVRKLDGMFYRGKIEGFSRLLSLIENNIPAR